MAQHLPDAQALFFDGTQRLAAGDAAGAETCLRAALALAPTLAEAHANLGLALEARGALAEAADSYRTSLAHNTTLPQTWVNLAGVLLLDPLVLDGRWAPPAAALVHVFTLGVLGNAMLGSLLQFLPVAAATPIPGANLAPWLHACLNAGLVLLVAGLYRLPGLLAPASVLLAAALLGIAVPTVPVLLRAGSQRLLRAGVGLALAMLTGTVLLGMLAAAVLGGHIVLPLDRLADGHASFGIGGWMLLLLGTVGATTVPMFQGTAAVPPRALKVWLATSAALLVTASVARLSGAPPWLPAASTAPPGANWPSWA